MKTGITPKKGRPLSTGAISAIGPVEPRGVIARFLGKPASVTAVVYILLIILMTIFASQLAPYGPDDQDLNAVLQGPSSTHWLGTGELGKDVLSRIMYGGRVTLVATLIALAGFVLIGVPLGIIAGYRGGRVDQFVLKASDISFSIPNVIVILVVLAIFPGNEFAAMAVWGILNAPGMARVVRSATLGVREELFVRAAVTSGIPDRVIIFRHILPLVVGVAIVQASVFGSGALLMETGLGFLGLGTQGASWGNLVGEASLYLGSNPWLLVPSGFLIISFIIALNLAGDGLRDSLAERYTLAPTRRRSGRRGVTDSRAMAVPPTPTSAEASASQSQPDPSDDVLLAVRHMSVSLSIDDAPTEVVSNVSFDLRRGEALGIVGESGCGKTITAVSLLGLLPPGGEITSGSVTFDGVDLTAASPSQLRHIRGGRIGWISQDPISSLDPMFSAGSQVSEAIRAQTKCSRRQARQRTLELFESVKLPEPERVYRSYPHQLSGGMAQRVGIAAAIASKPSLVIADEPTTALDVTVQAEILDLLRDLQQQGTAVILITHDWGVLADLCERAVVMYAGQVVEKATVVDVVTTPAHPYSAALLHSDPHNVEPGRRLPVLEGAVPAPKDWPTGCRFQNRCPLVTAECKVVPIPIVEFDDARKVRCIHREEYPVTLDTRSGQGAA